MAHAHAHADASHAGHEGPDAWHTHAEGGPKPQEAHSEQIDHKSVLFFGVAGFLIIVGCILATVVYFNWYKNQLLTDRVEYLDKASAAAPDAKPQEALHAEALARRSNILDVQFKTRTFPVTNPETGSVRLPMDDAMKKTMDSYKK